MSLPPPSPPENGRLLGSLLRPFFYLFYQIPIKLRLMLIQIVSLIILLGLFWGRSLAKRNRTKHIKIMYSFMAIDILFVLYLSLAREVLNKIKLSMPLILWVHIFLSLVVVCGYGYAIRYGRKLAHGEEQFRDKMILLDRIIMSTRVAVSVTAFFFR